MRLAPRVQDRASPGRRVECYARRMRDGQISAVTVRALALAGAGAFLGVALAAARPGGLDLKPRVHAASCEAPVVEPKRLSAADAAKMCARTDLIILDARPAADFAAGHIANAVHLPCDASGDVATSALGRDHGAVLVYGNSTDEAVAVARTIAQRTIAQVFALEGGFPAWETAGLACASGPCESCAQVGSPVSK
jgi:rhodanese-related sulfurtransferase